MLLTVTFCLNSKLCWKIVLYYLMQFRLIYNVSRSHLCFSNQEQLIPSEPLLTIYKIGLIFILFLYTQEKQRRYLL